MATASRIIRPVHSAATKRGSRPMVTPPFSLQLRGCLRSSALTDEQGRIVRLHLYERSVDTTSSVVRVLLELDRKSRKTTVSVDASAEDVERCRVREDLAVENGARGVRVELDCQPTSWSLEGVGERQDVVGIVRAGQ